MSEVKTKLKKSYDAKGNPMYTITEVHTLSDILRFCIEEADFWDTLQALIELKDK